MRPAESTLVALRKTLAEQLAVAEAKVVVLKEEIEFIDSSLKNVPRGGELPDTAETPRRTRGDMTMKALVIDALAQHFPDGATVGELLRCFSDIYERSDIARTSLSPQLTKLKEEGQITLDGRIWHLV